jgi:uncharacterized protein (DUF952 family)
MIFYHATTPDRWQQFANEDFYTAESLDTEGFIHASFAEQLDKTLSNYKDCSNVHILTIDSDLLTSELKVEASRNGELFPHIYGVLNKSAIVNITIQE